MRALFIPRDIYAFGAMELQHLYPWVTGTDDLSYPVGAVSEIAVSKDSTNKTGNLVLSNIQADYAVTRVAKSASVEAGISGEKSWRAEVMKKRNDLFVFHPTATDFMTDLMNAHTPTPQEVALAVRDVFIDNNHGAGISNVSSEACVTSASRARRTASAIACLEITPRHSSIMASQAMPLATCSRTSDTRIRVPRNVGSPWQISGSATIYLPRGCFFIKASFLR
jgi:hypothetical protein